MYSTSTQKRCWSFSSENVLNELRAQANERHISKFRPLILDQPEAENEFLTPAEEALLCRIVMDAGLRFGDEFRPEMWPAVRWIAFAYFKRFYLRQSTMEYYPKPMMMACYYLAAKTDEFTVSIDNFVDNLRNGTRENNIETILSLEPELMRSLDYHLNVHTPYRPFEGHLIDIKTRMANQLKFDIETIRPHSMEFFRKTLLGDTMFFYSPSQIALSAVKYGLLKIGKSDEFLHNYLLRLMEIDFNFGNIPENKNILRLEKLEIILEKICKMVEDQSTPIDTEQSTNLQKRMTTMAELQKVLGPKQKLLEKEQQNNGMIDSDDEF